MADAPKPDNPIEISFDDPPPARDTLDLTASPLDEPVVYPGFSGATEPPRVKVGKKPAVADIAGREVLLLALAGLCGGVLGWLLSEPLQARPPAREFAAMIAETGLYAGVVGAAIGLALGAGAARTVRGALWGALFGLVGGALGGAVAQYLYGGISLHYQLMLPGQVALRAVGWSIMGLFFGLGQAASLPAAKKLRNGILGGALGGLLGGVIFEFLHVAAGRGVALCLMGAAIGLLISLVEEATKEAWLRVIAGPLQGKQFILYDDRTTIGSDAACTITLAKDPAVAPEHAVITRDETTFRLAGAAPTSVNDRPVTRHTLRDGDVIGIGKSRLAFHERLAEPATKKR